MTAKSGNEAHKRNSAPGGAQAPEDLDLSSDAPKVDPAQDAYGYARFGMALANAARTTPSPKGLVMAVDGPWGSGKSTLLNFVKHYLAVSGTVDQLPIVIEANPWWFSDHEALASQFLSQFASQLPKTNKIFRKIGDAVAEYSDEIGKVAESGVGIPMSGMFVRWGLGKLKSKAKDVPKLKGEIAKLLREVDRRFVMIVDDIDRLAPDEIRQVFKVIKALADFPNVVYLMAFDRKVVAEALRESLGISDGDAYLEKIVQVQFVLPAVPRAKLLQKFLEDLNRVFWEIDESEFSTRWWNIYHEGLVPLITKPRDVVRIINALTVTFPVVKGEVNPVDFIALEFLRIFVPEAYLTIRDSVKEFVGAANRDKAERRQREQAFHEQWLNAVPESQRKPVKAIVENLFPRLQGLWGGFTYGAGKVAEWNAQLRIASPEMAPRFFQFGVEEGALSRAELDAFIELGENVDAIADGWVEAIGIRRADGSTKAREMLERVIEIEDLKPAFCRGCLVALFRVGDRYIEARDAIPAFFSIQPAIQMYWIVHHLFKCLPDAEREPFMLGCLRNAQALAVAVTITSSVDRMLQPSSEARPSVFQTFTQATLVSMKSIVVDLIRARAGGDLLAVPDLAFVLRCWDEWGSRAEVRAWLQSVIADDEKVLRFLRQYLQVGSTHTTGDAVAQRTVSMNPNLFEPYLQPPLDLSAFEARVLEVSSGRALAADEKEVVEAFQRGMSAIRRGRDPGSPFANMELE